MPGAACRASGKSCPELISMRDSIAAARRDGRRVAMGARARLVILFLMAAFVGLLVRNLHRAGGDFAGGRS
jgi:hypothetical protein